MAKNTGIIIKANGPQSYLAGRCVIFLQIETLESFWFVHLPLENFAKAAEVESDVIIGNIRARRPVVRPSYAYSTASGKSATFAHIVHTRNKDHPLGQITRIIDNDNY